MFQHSYRTYGLTLVSEIAFPELPVATGQPDVTIRYGQVPARLANVSGKGVFYELNANACLLNLEWIAGVRYLIEEGRTIIVERSATAVAEDVRLFLLCSGMGALLYQRNWFPLHGSAIQSAKGSVIFVGASGSGKSTLAAAFCKRGYPFIADDICVIAPDQSGQPCVVPGFPRLKLWADTAAQLGRATEMQMPVRPRQEKYLVPIQAPWVQEPAPVAAIYILTPTNSDEITLEALYGMEKVAPIQNNAYRDLFAIQMGKQQLLFQNALKLAQCSAVRRLKRPKHRFLLDELVTILEEDLA